MIFIASVRNHMSIVFTFVSIKEEIIRDFDSLFFLILKQETPGVSRGFSCLLAFSYPEKVPLDKNLKGLYMPYGALPISGRLSAQL